MAISWCLLYLYDVMIYVRPLYMLLEGTVDVLETLFLHLYVPSASRLCLRLEFERKQLSATTTRIQDRNWTALTSVSSVRNQWKALRNAEDSVTGASIHRVSVGRAKWAESFSARNAPPVGFLEIEWFLLFVNYFLAVVDVSILPWMFTFDNLWLFFLDSRQSQVFCMQKFRCRRCAVLRARLRSVLPQRMSGRVSARWVNIGLQSAFFLSTSLVFYLSIEKAGQRLH